MTPKAESDVDALLAGPPADVTRALDDGWVWQRCIVCDRPYCGPWLLRLVNAAHRGLAMQARAAVQSWSRTDEVAVWADACGGTVAS
jgi:hypothetical protein